MMKNKAAAVLASVVALVVAVMISAGAVNLPMADPVPTCTKPTASSSQQTNHQRMYDYAQCLAQRQEALTNNLHPVPTVTETVTTTVTASPTSTPTPTPTPTATPTGVPVVADFPTRSSVGPETDPTITYSGSCTVTTDGLVIDSRIVNCPSGLVVDATGVVIRNSIVNGGVFTSFGVTSAQADNDAHPTVFTVESSEVYSGPGSPDGRALGWAHFTVRDSLVEAHHSSLGAHNKVTATDNYLTTDGTDTHQSGMRMLKNGVVRGNTVVCKPSSAGYDGGCSGAAVFYAERIDGAPMPSYNLTIDRNYFKRGVTPGGAAGGPWFAIRFSGCTSSCTNIDVTWNLFDLGWGTDGGEHVGSATGSSWADNYWTDGTTAESNESR